MNNYQTARQKSYKLIVLEAKNDPQSTSLISSFAEGINRLGAICTEIDTIGIQQAKNITGVTSGKNALMNDLIDYMIDVSGAIHSLAIAKGDKVLQARVDYKESVIARMPQAELLKAAAIILEEADKIAPEELVKEGIAATEMSEFKAAYTQCSDMSSDTRDAIINRSVYTQKLADLFAEASDLKKNTLDRLATQFQRKAPEFYQKYKAAATVIYKRSPKAPVAAEQV